MKITTTLACAFLLTLPLAATSVLADEVIRLSEPVEVTDDYEVFGSRIEQMGEPKRLAEIVANQEAYIDEEVFVQARVTKVCQRKGCFFIAQDGEAVARVTFKDYGFFVPTDSGGKQVTIVGTFARTTVSEEKARHYAEDAGEDASKVIGARPEYSIVATAVVVPKSRS